MKNHLPVAAIIGRPNTGKSSLFNFLVNEKKSIVDHMQGVTRDIVSGTVRQESFPEFTVWDTAGYLESRDILDSLAQEKIRYAVRNADLIILMVDSQNPHPLDSELALLIKKENKATIIAANKADNRAYGEEAAEFYRLGFEIVIPISVIQKRGLTSLLEEMEALLFKKHHFSITENTNPDEVRITIAGRPNSGKSMLLNTLLGYERMIVSDIAGTTRDAADETISFRNRTIRITDTAGIKRNAKIKNDIEYYAAVRSAQAIEHAEVIILLIDAHASLDEIARHDKIIASMIHQKKRAMVFALNKWDLIKPQDHTGKRNQDLMKEVERKIRQALPEFDYVPICFISAKNNYKTDKLLETAVKVRDDFYHRVVTGTFNKWLSENLIEYEGERTASRLKIYYGSQVYTAPPRFVFFINKKDYMRKDFPRFLEKRLRLAFEFTGVPITLTFRERGLRMTLGEKHAQKRRQST